MGVLCVCMYCVCVCDARYVLRDLIDFFRGKAIAMEQNSLGDFREFVNRCAVARLHARRSFLLPVELSSSAQETV